MHFTRARLNAQRRCGEVVVRTMHAALRRRFLVLLNCHDNSRKILRILTQLDMPATQGPEASHGAKCASRQLI
jgi:phage terminase large subunit-like protein